jgi:ribose/xylose/arabinose/galactoside ABC-type transport system permease subunit
VSLFGGSGSVLKAMLGVLIYVLLTNIMNLANVDTYVQYIVQGIIILFAVAVSGIAQMRRKSEGKTQ